MQILFYLFKSSSLSHSRKVQLWTFSHKVEFLIFSFYVVAVVSLLPWASEIELTNSGEVKSLPFSGSWTRK